MKVLILGKGGREHALAWKFAKSHRITGLYTAPGNAGTLCCGENIADINCEDPKAVLEICREKEIDLVFVGPEGPLAAGVVDILTDAGIAAIGPPKRSAVLESSKVFSKQFMQRHRIPTARSKEFSSKKDYTAYLRKFAGSKIVVKKNGLAAGKGVLESDDRDALHAFGERILESDSLLVEEYLKGYEITVLALTDGKNWTVMPPCADFKKSLDNDLGMNSGGMGAICPVPVVNAQLMAAIEKTIIKPTFDGLAKERLSYKGILYFGLMITKNGPKLLEYNVRFGDPEAQVLLPLVETDFGNICHALQAGKLAETTITYFNDFALGVVMASAGYPGDFETGKAVTVSGNPQEKQGLIFHSATTVDKDGTIRTGGGRCFTVVGFGDNLVSANKRAYETVNMVRYEGAYFRTDIGQRFFMDGAE